MKNHKYTEEQCEWIKENYPILGITEGFKAFQERFGFVSTIESFKSKRRDLKVHVTEDRWKEACQNNGKRTNVPIGTVTKRGRGENFIKVSDGTEGWVPLKRHILGDIQKDEMIVHLDGDKANDSVDNLMVIDRRTGAAMTGNKMWSEDGEITKTGILCCKLDLFLKDSSISSTLNNVCN